MTARRRVTTLTLVLTMIAAVAGPGGWLLPLADAALAANGPQTSGCGCPKTGAYVDPAASVAPKVSPDGTSPKGAYRVTAISNGSIQQVSVATVATGAIVLAVETNLTQWGFSPDDERFVVSGATGSLATVQLYNLANADPLATFREYAFSTADLRFGFSPHGRYLVSTWISRSDNAHVSHQIVEAATGDKVYETSYRFQTGAAEGGKFGEAGFGFSPDDGDRTFVFAYVTGQGSTQLSLVNLAERRTVYSPQLTGVGFWKFSPCGAALALLQQHNQATVDIHLLATADGATMALLDAPVGSVSFKSTSESHIAVVGGQEIVLAANRAGVPCPTTPDTSAPVWPVSRTLSTSDITETSLTLSWSAANDNVGVTRYRVYQGPALVATLGAPTTTHTLKTLAPGTSYTLKVEAGDAASNWTTNGPVLTVTTPGTAPACPATTQDLGVSNITNTGLTLRSGTLVGATGYRLYQNGSHVGGGSGGTTRVSLLGLQPASSYTVTIHILDETGTCVESRSRTVTTTNFTTLDTNTIQGMIWNDANGNGRRDVGESVINNQGWPTVGIYLYRLDDGPSPDIYLTGFGAGASLGFNGFYEFTNVPDGRYAVALITWPRVQTFPADNQPQIVEIVNGKGRGAVSFGLRTGTFPDFGSGTAAISGLMWDDLDGDGVRDGDEPGLPGAEVRCTEVARGTSCVNEVTLTDGTGAYALQYLPAGTYYLYPSSDMVGGVGRYMTRPHNDQRYLAILPTGVTARGAEYGFGLGTGVISGQVWHDRNADGARAEADVPIDDSIPIEVCAQGRTTGTSCVMTAAGAYTIGSLAPDTYDVSIKLPRDWTQTLPAERRSQVVTIDSVGAAVQDIDFGVAFPGDLVIVRPPAVGNNRVWARCNSDGIEPRIDAEHEGSPATYSSGTFTGSVNGAESKAHVKTTGDRCGISLSSSDTVTIEAGDTGLAPGTPVYVGMTIALDGTFKVVANGDGGRASLQGSYHVDPLCEPGGEICPDGFRFWVNSYAWAFEDHEVQEWGTLDEWQLSSGWETLDSVSEETMCLTECDASVVKPFDTGALSIVFQSHVGAALELRSAYYFEAYSESNAFAEADFSNTFTSSGLQPAEGFEGLVFVYGTDGSQPDPGESQPPVVSAGGPYSVDEGGSITVTANPGYPDGGNLTYIWDLDSDGIFETVGQSVDFSAAGFDGPVSVSVAVQATDTRGETATSSATIEVRNVAPGAAIDGAPSSALEGETISLVAIATDSAPADVLSSAWSVTKDGAPFSSGAGETFAFTPDDDGTYIVTLVVSDDDGGEGVATVEVAVANVAPVLALGPDTTLRRGETFGGAGTFNDPGADEWSATADYGDGSGAQPLELGTDGTFTLSHVYTRAGGFSVQVCVDDGDGGQGCDSLAITVTPYAIFSGLDDCGSGSLGVEISGSKGQFFGDLHVNGGGKVSGAQHRFTGVVSHHCGWTTNGARTTYSSDPTQVTDARPWPTLLTPADFACDLSVNGKLDLSKDGVWWVNGEKSSRQLATLTICAGEITLGESNVSGTLTLVAERIHLSGSGLQLTAAQHGVLVYASGSGPEAIRISGSKNALTGDLVARQGTIQLSGSGTALAGAAIGWRVSISGNDWIIDASGGASP